MLFTVIIEIYLYFFVFFLHQNDKCLRNAGLHYQKFSNIVGVVQVWKLNTGQVRKEYEQVPPQS